MKERIMNTIGCVLFIAIHKEFYNQIIKKNKK